MQMYREPLEYREGMREDKWTAPKTPKDAFHFPRRSVVAMTATMQCP